MATEDIGSLVVRIETNLKNFNKGMDNVSERVDRIGGGVRKLGGIIAGAFATGAIIGFGKHLVTVASDAAEMQSKFNTVFGSISQDAEAWASSFRDKIGGSRVQIKGMLADSQDLLTGFGATTDEAFEFSTKMQALGSDLASFQNIQGGAAEAVDRLRKGLLGQHENLLAMGIVINETALQQELASRGDQRRLQDLSELEKIELRYAIAVRQSKNAIGDAEKTKDSYTNKVRDLSGKILDLKVAIGENLLPKVTEFVTFLTANLPAVESFINSGIDKFNSSVKFLTDNSNILIPVIAGLTSAILAQSIIGGITSLYKAWQLATTAQTTAQWLLNAAMSANPIGLVAAAIGALIAIGVLLWKNWDTVREKFINVWGGISTGVKNIVNNIVGYWNFLIDKAFDAINAVTRLANKIPGVNIPQAEAPQIPKLAKGTTNFSGGPAIVGELGRELVNLPRGSQVFSNRQTESMLNGIDYNKLGQAVADALRQSPMQVNSYIDGQKAAKSLWPRLVAEKDRLGVSTL